MFKGILDTSTRISGVMIDDEPLYAMQLQETLTDTERNALGVTIQVGWLRVGSLIVTAI
jgi:hypothetical protein